MGKFNKQLSQLEAVYQIAEPVLKQVDALNVSDFIHHVFENQEKYSIEGLSKEWFRNYSARNQIKATNFVTNLLSENEQLVSKKSILEGMELFNKDE